LGRAMECGVDQEVSRSGGLSRRGSANNRMGGSGIVIEQSHRRLNISLPANTPRTEELGDGRALPHFLPPPTRRSESDPVQEGRVSPKLCTARAQSN
jgi:hypothetical protein